MPDGRIWNGLSKLRKDNTGYDLKHLFIGAEGTLGVVTAAVLKLFPSPRSQDTAFVAVSDPHAAVSLLSKIREICSGDLVSFEYLPRVALELTGSDPLGEGFEHYVLFELVDQDPGLSETSIERVLTDAMHAGLILDGTVAQSREQRNSLWQIREGISPAQKESVKNDVSVPVSRVAELLSKGPSLVETVAPGARPCPFGHIGDGNIHYNILAPTDQDPVDFRRKQGKQLVSAINDLVVSLDGSFSAEHGVGQLRKPEFYKYTDPLEIELMRKIKKALDPAGLMNPGKVI